MLKILVTACAFLAASFLPALAQQSERAQEMQRVIDLMNSADPVTRMMTFEEVLSSKDKNLKRIGMSTAFASSDLTLRSMALEAAIATKKSFIVEFISSESEKTTFANRCNKRLEVYVQDYNAETGEFLAYTPYSHGRKKQYVGRAGNVSGDRVSFELMLESLVMKGGANCTATLVAEVGTSQISGPMACSALGSTERYQVTADLLR